MSNPAQLQPTEPKVEPFFDPVTATVTYVVHAGRGTACAIVDPVLDYDPKSGRTSTESAERVTAFVREHGLRVEWLLETHAHADHLSAAPYSRQRNCHLEASAMSAFGTKRTLQLSIERI